MDESQPPAVYVLSDAQLAWLATQLGRLIGLQLDQGYGYSYDLVASDITVTATAQRLVKSNPMRCWLDIINNASTSCYAWPKSNVSVTRGYLFNNTIQFQRLVSPRDYTLPQAEWWLMTPGANVACQVIEVVRQPVLGRIL